tara:strand:- start:77 stop:553 length:477 start_codon:yes stop_codon:yes gene_type:complete
MAVVKYHKETCSRCGGSGEHSYNQLTGSVCFKCHGAKEVTSKIGMKAREFATSILEDTLENFINDGTELVKMRNGRQRYFHFDNYTKEEEPMGNHLVGGVAVQTYKYTFFRKGKEVPALNVISQDYFEKRPIRKIPTTEQVEEISNYQDKLLARRRKK